MSSLWKTRRALPPQRLGDHLCVLPHQKETERHLGYSSKIKKNSSVGQLAAHAGDPPAKMKISDEVGEPFSHTGRPGLGERL